MKYESPVSSSYDSTFYSSGGSGNSESSSYMPIIPKGLTSII